MTSAHSFLQSSAWEDFQHALGRKTWRVAGVLVIRHDLPMGLHYLYAPHPVIHGDLFSEMRAIAAAEKSVFLKIDPLVSLQPTTYKLQASISLQPRETIVIDLTQAEEILLSGMHEKTRYNIRLAERKGVAVKNYWFPVADADFAAFWRLMQETAERDRFHAHPKEHYKKLLDAHTDDFSNELFLAEYQGMVIAAAIVNFYHYRGETSIVKTATYLHGASGSEHRGVMAPHLLHWRIMQEAVRRGCGSYDLWGADAVRWPGLTRFKTGFGGATLVHPASSDMIYRAGWYRAYSSWKRFFGK
ncbi:MAG: hypothetical protein A3B34_00445 [Candidatus Sungbacteria bacterium RIFCSPLOWO2_01_FULL_54_21]|uniref:BioF2-like acetyltransferase domain-containing protein n=1 Tax=Candidatus Sungbacteria bacterium RIFCSPLOWO2_01_FULL_54_21 TaxID=1802279 RepID=A0A1G2L7R1_9BACT|nr:MAG: hypothetical protein A2679_02925 [Candidatus Sungbacteria bacterium RIFCSPHIGHO2_01_FULL_54_26]OHA07697.1 MAG: hypothetical protein A3B34_00445 [Candidatus Sungbacteria bacterium RIFCSPLOWO2_01_FULL_54_21]